MEIGIHYRNVTLANKFAFYIFKPNGYLERDDEYMK